MTEEEATAESVGDIAIVLHSHMPYVEGFGTYPFGEEWLFDAVVRSHLPVLQVARDVTVTITPVLADQLEDAGVSDRLVAISPGSSGSDRPSSTSGTSSPRWCPPARRRPSATGRRSPSSSARRRRRWTPSPRRSVVRAGRARGLVGDPRPPAPDRDPAGAAASARDRPAVSSAPLRGLSRALAARSARYEPGLEHLLDELGIDWFCVDQSASEPPPAAMRPIATGGPVAFPIDWEAVQWLWSWSGYPSDPVYADFHAKSLRGCRPWSIAGEPYDPAAATIRAGEQAREFAVSVAERLTAHRADSGRRRTASRSPSTPNCSGIGGGRVRSGSNGPWSSCGGPGSDRSP